MAKYGPQDLDILNQTTNKLKANIDSKKDSLFQSKFGKVNDMCSSHISTIDSKIALLNDKKQKMNSAHQNSLAWSDSKLQEGNLDPSKLAKIQDMKTQLSSGNVQKLHENSIGNIDSMIATLMAKKTSAVSAQQGLLASQSSIQSSMYSKMDSSISTISSGASGLMTTPSALASSAGNLSNSLCDNQLSDGASMIGELASLASGLDDIQLEISGLPDLDLTSLTSQIESDMMADFGQEMNACQTELVAIRPDLGAMMKTLTLQIPIPQIPENPLGNFEIPRPTMPIDLGQYLSSIQQEASSIMGQVSAIASAIDQLNGIKDQIQNTVMGGALTNITGAMDDILNCFSSSNSDGSYQKALGPNFANDPSDWTIQHVSTGGVISNVYSYQDAVASGNKDLEKAKADFDMAHDLINKPMGETGTYGLNAKLDLMNKSKSMLNSNASKLSSCASAFSKYK